MKGDRPPNLSRSSLFLSLSLSVGTRKCTPNVEAALLKLQRIGHIDASGFDRNDDGMLPVEALLFCVCYCCLELAQCFGGPFLILVWFGEEHKNVQSPSAPLDASPCRAVDFLFIRTSDDGRELHLDLCFVFPSVRAKTRAATDVCVRFAKFALRCGGTVVGYVPYCIVGCLSSERCANHQSDANPRVSPVFPTKRSLRPLFLLRLY